MVDGRNVVYCWVSSATFLQNVAFEVSLWSPGPSVGDV